MVATLMDVRAAEGPAMVSFNRSISVPPATASGPGPHTVSGQCTAPAGSKFFTMATHTHKHATAAIIDFVSGGTTTEVVHTGAATSYPADQLPSSGTDWEHSGVGVWDAPTFLTTASGDYFTYSCSYENTGSTTVTVGETAGTNEMVHDGRVLLSRRDDELQLRRAKARQPFFHRRELRLPRELALGLRARYAEADRARDGRVREKQANEPQGHRSRERRPGDPRHFERVIAKARGHLVRHVVDAARSAPLDGEHRGFSGVVHVNPGDCGVGPPEHRQLSLRQQRREGLRGTAAGAVEQAVSQDDALQPGPGPQRLILERRQGIRRGLQHRRHAGRAGTRFVDERVALVLPAVGEDDGLGDESPRSGRVRGAHEIAGALAAKPIRRVEVARLARAAPGQRRQRVDDRVGLGIGNRASDRLWGQGIGHDGTGSEALEVASLGSGTRQARHRVSSGDELAYERHPEGTRRTCNEDTLRRGRIRHDAIVYRAVARMARPDASD